MSELTPNIYAMGCQHFAGWHGYRTTTAHNGTLTILWYRCPDCGKGKASVTP